MHQHDNESLLKHCRRFIAAAEHIEEVWGEIEPDELIGAVTKSGDNKAGRDQFLASVFVAGSNRTKFEDHRKKLADDHADDQVSKHPKMVEEAVAVMQACLDDHTIKIRGANFHQADLSKIECFKCKKMGHCKKDCPENKEESEDDDNSSSEKKSTSHLRVWGA